MSSPSTHLPRGPEIDFEGARSVLKPPAHRRQRKPSYKDLEMFRAIDGPDFPANLAERRPGLRSPVFYYGLELGAASSDFHDRMPKWREHLGFYPSLRQVYGCSFGSGWIISFCDSNQAPHSRDVMEYFIEQLGIGQPKWFLSFEFPTWRWV